jgi:hypothetical protein
MEYKSSTFSIQELYNWYKSNELKLNPLYQRRNVWSSEGKSFFLDTLFRGLPTHKIFLREVINYGKGTKEVVDGQQRLRTIFDFIDDAFRINNKTELQNYGKKYSEFIDEQKKWDLLNYSISVDMLLFASDKDVRDLFLRLNRYSITLNQQELRNAKFHGEFKQFVSNISGEFYDKLKWSKIISKRSYIRMFEEELIAEIIIAMMDGLQDKKKSINIFYEKYDEKFFNKRRIYNKFKEIFNIIINNYGDVVKNTNIKRKAIFYSLFLIIYDILYGLKGQKGPYKVDILSIDLKNKLLKIDDIIKNPDKYPNYSYFIESCSRQTDNIKPRQTRHDFILNIILNKEGI